MKRSLNIIFGLLSILLTGLLLVAIVLPHLFIQIEDSTPASTSAVVETTTPTQSTPPTQSTLPTEPPVVKESTFTLGATGDILLHKNVIRSGYDKTTDTYDFTHFFQYLKDYISGLDYAVGNMEGTLAGNENGYNYSGYPQFNAPDAIVDAAKDAGFDMLLTANNHSYDTRSFGFHRTQEIISGMGLDYIGTRPSADVKNYIIKDIQGVKIGMSNYTYDTRHETGDHLSLNSIPLNAADTSLVNTFNQYQLDAFYEKLEQEIASMRSDGAQIIILFIHWGDEYHIEPNNTQKAMAQKLCDMGVDVIIGGHPHVIQPVEMLTSTTQPERNTICIYSLGNSVSNIRGSRYPLEAMDCIFFTLTFAKYSDGSVLVEKAEILPYYVNRYWYTSAIPYRYPLVPLNLPQEQWKEAYDLTDEMFAACQASLDRTNAIVAEGLLDVNTVLAQRQIALETALGISQ